jgi:hypothetical protein
MTPVTVIAEPVVSTATIRAFPVALLVCDQVVATSQWLP